MVNSRLQVLLAWKRIRQMLRHPELSCLRHLLLAIHVQSGDNRRGRVDHPMD